MENVLHGQSSLSCSQQKTCRLFIPLNIIIKLMRQKQIASLDLKVPKLLGCTKKTKIIWEPWDIIHLGISEYKPQDSG